MALKPKDFSVFINKKFNNLLILSICKKEKNYVASCLCDCGKTTQSTNLQKLIKGKVISCKFCSNKNNGRLGNISQLKHSKHNNLIGQTIYYFTILSRAQIDAGEPAGTFKCKCVCGEIRFLDAFDLTKSKDRKSCGCQQSRLNSLSQGGTGIPYEQISVNEYLRKNTEEYNLWTKMCLVHSNYTCAISGQHGGKLNIHHIIPLKQIIISHGITIKNYLTFTDILFDKSNGIALSEAIHKHLHQTYGNEVSLKDILEYRDTYYPTK